MLKKIIILFFYFAFFILIPIAVYFYWPVSSTNSVSHYSDSSALSNDFERLLLNQNEMLSQVERSGNVGYAIMICFPISIFLGFLVALHKYLIPENKTTSVAIGIFVFNLLYIPFYFILSFTGKSFSLGYSFISVFTLVMTPLGIIVVVMLLLLFITTIILIIIGSTRKVKKNIPQQIVRAIATVKNSRAIPIDDQWGEIISEIELCEHIPTEAFSSISGFSHLEIIYCFDKVLGKDIVFSGHPRGNPDYPLVGIFAQRKKDRPNAIGLCTVELIEHNGRTIKVKYLDAIDGTPVLDIKPVFKEFQPKGEIKQPAWVSELMNKYW